MGRDEVLAQVRQDVEAAQEPVDWRPRAEAAEAKLAEIRAYCELTKCSTDCVGHSVDAAEILAVIGTEEESDGR